MNTLTPLHPASYPIPNGTPEETGIPASSILRFLERLESHQLPMHSILLMRHGKLAAEGYYAPYGQSTLHRMYSICKSLNALAVGLLEEEGKLSLDDPIADYFPDKVPENVHPWISSMTIRHLLMMRTCHASTTYKLYTDVEWVESFFITPPSHKPGTVFHYDTSASHVLCMLVQRLSGKSMLAFLKERVLYKIGWDRESYVIENSFGDPMGGSGLMCTPRELLALGKLLLQHGEWEGEQLLPRAFVDIAVSGLTPNTMTGPVTSEMQGYGYQIWRTQHNGFVLYGMGGQLAVCLPDYDMVCVTTADTQGIGGGNQLIYQSLFEEILPALDSPEEDTVNHASLQEKLSSLRILPVSTQAVPAFSEESMKKDALISLLPKALSFPTLINGHSYSLEKNSQGFTDIILHLEEKQGQLEYTLNGEKCMLFFGLDVCRPGHFPLYGFECATSAAWISHDTFYIKSYLTDTAVGSVHMELVFGEDDVTIFMKKIEETMLAEYNCHLYGRRQ